MALFPTLVLLVALGSPAAALYEKDGPVLQLGIRSFDKVTKSKVPVVVEFFAPWCGHCKALAPAFTKAASKLQGIVPFVAVDCDKESNRPLCGQYGVQGFPTIKLFSPGAPSPADYMGERSAKALADAAIGLLTAKHVKRIKSAADASQFASGSGTKVVLVTDKADTPAMLKSLSQRFASQGLTFARVQAKTVQDPAAAEVLEALGGPISSVPALFAVKPDGSRTVYDGETKAPKILEWLKGLAGAGKPAAGAADSADTKQASTAGSGSEDAHAELSGGRGGKGSREGSSAGEEQGRQGKREKEVAEIPQVVANVTAAELARRLEKEGVLVVAFFAGSQEACREQLNKLNAAVHGLHGLASGVQVDLSAASEAAAVQDLYSIALPDPGERGCEVKTFLLPFDPEDHEDSDEWRPWLGELAAKDLHKAAVELFPAVGITRVTTETYPQFAASLNGAARAKILLFTDKEEPPAVYRALSANFRRYSMDFGLVGSNEKGLLQQFKVSKVPYLLALFAATGVDAKPTTDGQNMQVPIQVVPFNGPVRYGTIAAWLTFVALQTGIAPEDALQQFGGQRRDAMVAQVTDQESWQSSCLSKGGVCVIAALSSQPDEQAAQLEVLRSAAEGRGEQPLHFSWFELPASGSTSGSGADKAAAAFAAQLGLGGSTAPALVAVAPRKERSAVMTARFEKAAISEWLDGLLSGNVRTAPLQRLPAFPAADEAPAGSGAEAEEAVEEEFDLSEIMNEEIEGDLSKLGRKDEL